MDPDPLHYYSLLNLPPGATQGEIKENYQRLSLILHPDKQPEHFRVQATEQFTRLEEAKEVLLDPAKRFAYDHYGEAGLAILHQNQSKFAHESWQLASPIDRRLFNEKIRRLIKQSNEQLLRSELNPRTELSITLSLAEYWDSNGEDPMNLRPVSVQLQEMVRVQLAPSVAGSVGCMVYTKGSLGVTVLTPRMYWSLGAGMNVQVAAQIGEKNSSCTLALYKSFHDLTLSAQVGFSPNNTLTVLSATCALSPSTTAKADLHLGPQPQLSLSAKRKVGLHSSFSPSLRFHGHGADLGLQFHWRVMKRVAGFVSATVAGEETKNDLVRHFSVAAGLRLKLTKFTKATYSLELEEGEVRAIFGVTRGGFNIRVPMILSRVLNASNILVAGAALGLCAFATRALHSYFYDDPLKEGKRAKKEEQRQVEIGEGRRAAEEYVMMIRSKALQSALSEQERRGLVILEAYYGHLSLLERVAAGATVTSTEIYDVTQQLQVLVEHHRLLMPAASKGAQYGFFNPCLDGETPLGLLVKFQYGGETGRKLVKDIEALSLP